MIENRGFYTIQPETLKENRKNETKIVSKQRFPFLKCLNGTPCHVVTVKNVDQLSYKKAQTT